jgi:hypothetical protein
LGLLRRRWLSRFVFVGKEFKQLHCGFAPLISFFNRVIHI